MIQTGNQHKYKQGVVERLNLGRKCQFYKATRSEVTKANTKARTAITGMERSAPRLKMAAGMRLRAEQSTKTLRRRFFGLRY